MLAGEGFGFFTVFGHSLINRLERLRAVGALRESFDPFHGVLGIVGVGLGGVGSCDRRFFGTVGGTGEPLADSLVVFLCPPGGEFEGTFFRDLVRYVAFCKPVEPLASFAYPHLVLHALGGSDKFVARQIRRSDPIGQFYE